MILLRLMLGSVGSVTRSVKLAGTASLIALFAPVGARVDALSRDVGSWIVTASSDGKGCFLTKRYDRTGGTTLLLGLDVDGTNRLTVLNDNWSIMPGDRLNLGFRLSNASFPSHAAIGLASDGKKGFVASFGAKFPATFAASRTLRIVRGEVPVEQLTLDGAGAAVAELRACVGKRASPTAAPANAGKTRSSIPVDPFAAPPRPIHRK